MRDAYLLSLHVCLRNCSIYTGLLHHNNNNNNCYYMLKYSVLYIFIIISLDINSSEANCVKLIMLKRFSCDLVYGCCLHVKYLLLRVKFELLISYVTVCHLFESIWKVVPCCNAVICKWPVVVLINLIIVLFACIISEIIMWDVVIIGDSWHYRFSKVLW